MKAVMTPTPPKTEGDIADSIDKWLETMRSLDEMKDEYKLSDPFKITALKIMMVGRAREHFEQIELNEGADYSKVLNQCKEYATRRRLEANMKKRNRRCNGRGSSGATIRHPMVRRATRVDRGTESIN